MVIYSPSPAGEETWNNSDWVPACPGSAGADFNVMMKILVWHYLWFGMPWHFTLSLQKGMGVCQVAELFKYLSATRCLPIFPTNASTHWLLSKKMLKSATTKSFPLPCLSGMSMPPYHPICNGHHIHEYPIYKILPSNSLWQLHYILWGALSLHPFQGSVKVMELVQQLS